MATKHPQPLTADELVFWKASFVAAELSLLKGNTELSPEGAAHLAAEYAHAAVAELRQVTNQ